MLGKKNSLFDLSIHSFPTGCYQRGDTGIDWLHPLTSLLKQQKNLIH